MPLLEGGLLTTNFFAFDDVDDHYGLRPYNPKARAVDMDNAALGFTIQDIGTAGPGWVSSRNASDPQLNEPTLAEETTDAANIY